MMRPVGQGNSTTVRSFLSSLCRHAGELKRDGEEGDSLRQWEYS